MKFPALAALAFASLSFLTGCLTSGGGSTTQSDPPGFKSLSSAYRLEAGKIVLGPATRIDRECTDTGLGFETISRSSFTIPFELDGDSLKLMLGGPQTDSLGTSIQIYDIHVRVSRGTGLQGRWLLVGQRYRVVLGNATAEDITRFDGMMASADIQRRFTDVHYIISRDSFATFIDTKNAEQFIAYWNGLYLERPEDVDSGKYDISLRFIERDVVELNGLKTGETVRLKMADDKSRDYSSDEPGHVPYHYDDTPESCPNLFEPDWYWEFLEANLKIVAD